ncbi:MAG: DUF3572 domain-containing protein [Rhizobiaceae bacterium]|nr:DUF3572 domain-containing protein [Rhizobiaceae bacterium]
MPGGRKTAAPGGEEAEAMAIRILGWLTGQPELLGRFLALTGIEAGSIRRAAAEPGFLAGLTGFVMAHEPTLMAFCAENDVKADRVSACHHRLAGPESENWP